ncbi:MAG: hypothetical protein JEY99_12915 [Spirochaetales bacterium]|nr:hypothetical protein [Spirochaetales bacterium]
MLCTVRNTFIFKAAFFLFAASMLYAFEENLILGTDDQWSSLAMMDGVQLKPGWEGYPDLTLADGEYSLSPQNALSDLILHFNGPGQYGVSPLYKIGDDTESFEMADKWNYSYREKVFGNASLALQSESPPFIIHPQGTALLARGNTPEDFSIEFWLYPARLSEGEEIFSWEGGWWGDGDLLAQGINCMVADQRLLWNFRNFFLPPGGAETEFVLHGDTILLPRKWHHHLIRYDSLSGFLEYLIDGNPEAMIYTTPTKHEEGEIYLPVSGSLADTKIQLGSGYIGLLDELRISSHLVEEPQLERYLRLQGSVVTRVFDLAQSETRIREINVRESKPGNSDIFYYFRISDKLFNEDDPDLSWQEFNSGAALPSGISGRYIQLRVELLPDGTGEISPSVSAMEIVYQSKLPPLPPAYVIASPGDGSVLLKWNAMSDAESRGFRIFYGEKPGIYFGTSAVFPENDSPIDVGNRTEYLVEGLTNGKLYYFAIMAYTGTYGDLLSEFSREVSARPSPLHGNP